MRIRTLGTPRDGVRGRAPDSRGGRTGGGSSGLPAGSRLPFAIGTLVAFLVGWNADVSDVSSGLDAGWQAGLYMATRQGLDFGREVVFTYGPLGFLKFPVAYYTSLAAASFVYVVAVQLLTAAALVWAGYLALHRWVLAIIFAATATSILAEPRIWELGGAAPVQVLLLVACAHAIRSDAPSWLRVWLAAGGGVLAGIEVLAKLNLGVIVTLMVIFTLAVVGSRRRYLGLFAASFSITAALAWFGTGQSVTNLDDYVRMSFEIVRAWPLSVGSTDGPDAVTLLALAATAVVLGGAWVTTSGLALRTRLSITALTVLFLLGLFKSSLVTDGSHNFIYFCSAVGAWFAFSWWPRRMLSVAAFAALVGIYFAAAVLRPLTQGKTTLSKVVGVNPINNRPTGLLDTPSPEAGRAKLRAEYRLSGPVLRLIGHRPVHISAYETSIAWAYQLNWRPLPLFQPNLATTPPLDRVNARALQSANGPDRILRSSEDLFEQAPATTIAMLCHYRQLLAESRWQVLGRTRNQCGRRRVIRRLIVRPGQKVTVPQARGAIVLASIRGLEYGFFESAAIGFVPRDSRTIFVDGRAEDLEASVAPAGLVMRVPRALAYPFRFRISPQANSISVATAAGQKRITIEFQSLSVPGSG